MHRREGQLSLEFRVPAAVSPAQQCNSGLRQVCLCALQWRPQATVGYRLSRTAETANTIITNAENPTVRLSELIPPHSPHPAHDRKRETEVCEQEDTRQGFAAGEGRRQVGSGGQRSLQQHAGPGARDESAQNEHCCGGGQHFEGQYDNARRGNFMVDTGRTAPE